MHTQTRGQSPVLTSAVFLIGRGAQVFGLTLASSFLHSNALSILIYTFCVAALSGGFLATTQRAWRTMRAINRKHFVPLVINSALIITAFITFSFGLKNAGAIRTVMMESYTHVLIYLPALFCGWSTLKSNKSKQHGVIAMVIALVLLIGTAQITSDPTNFGSLSSSSLDGSIGRKLLMAPDPIVSNTNSSNANPAIPAVPAVPAAAAASSDEEEDTQRVGVGVASIVGNKPASISERLKARRTSPVTPEAISSNSDELNAEQIQKEDLEPAAQDSNQMDPTLSPAEEEKLKQQQQQVQQAIDAMTKGVPPSSDFDFFFFRLSAPIIGLFSLLVSLFITQLQQKYEKSHAKEFEGKKRLHAMSLLMGCVLLVVPIAFQSVAFTSTPSELSFFTTFITLIIITLFTSILQFYLDVFEQKIEMNVMVKMNFIASFLFASFFDIIRSDDRLTWSTAIAAIIIFYGLHNLLKVMRRDGSTPGSPSTPSIIPVYSRSTPKSTSSSLSFRELRLVYKHVMADRTTMKIFTFLCINFTFMFVEMIYGYWTNSLGLISDAGHMLFDCTALAIGLYASYVSKIKANGQYTYGYARYEILSGYVNGVFLLFIGYFVFVESIERLFEAPEIHSENLAVVAALGFGVNLIGLFFFHDHSHGHSHGGDGHGHSHGGHGGHGGHGDATAAAQANANTYGIYLHIAADTLGSVGVIISSLLVDNLGWTSADAICSIVISVLIILSVWPLIKQTAQVLLQRTPVFKAQPLRQALAQILTIDGVISYRHPHFWQFTEAELVGTLHVQVKEDADGQRILNAVTEILKDSHGPGVNNLTIQIEKEEFLQHLDPSVRLQFHMSGGNL